MAKTNWWMISVTATALGLIWLSMQWNDLTDPKLRVDPARQLERGETKVLRDWEKANAQLLIDIPTGIFLQSMKFLSSSEVNLTGYIWQHRDNQLRQFDPRYGESGIGFIFPEEVDSSNATVREAYRIPEKCKAEDNLYEAVTNDPGVKRGGKTVVIDAENRKCELIGWYFESTLRQNFKYTNYPFDHKNIWIRMWPAEFSDNVVLSPDFGPAYVPTYDDTSAEATFGLERQMVFGPWEPDNTFFSYETSSYDTNFGIQQYVGKSGFPELHYNFVIKRKLTNALIVHLLPLFVVAGLLYAALLTISEKKVHGFSTSGVIGTCSALFFVIIIAHTQLREQFGGGPVYIEWFYFFMYAMLIAAAAYTFGFASKKRWFSFTHYEDNLILKTTYWPFLVFMMVLITHLTTEPFEIP